MSSLKTAAHLNQTSQFAEAIDVLYPMLQESPSHYNAIIEISLSYQRLRKFQVALNYAFKSLEIAKKRSQRKLIAQSYFKLGVLFFLSNQYLNSLKYFTFAQSYDYPDQATLGIWIKKSSNKLVQLDIDFELLDLNEDLTKLDYLNHKILLPVPKSYKVSEASNASVSEASISKELNPSNPQSPNAPAVSSTSNISNVASEDSSIFSSNDKNNTPKNNIPKIEPITDSEASTLKPAPARKQNIQVISAPPKVSKPIKAPISREITYPKTFRTDFFQNGTLIDASVFIKFIPKETLEVTFSESCVEFSFKDSKSEKQFYYSIDLSKKIIPKESSYKLFGSKLELFLTAVDDSKWSTLEQVDSEDDQTEHTDKDGSSKDSIHNIPQAMKYPSSSKSKTDWANIDIGVDEKDQEDEMSFFKTIFKDASDETRRAMMKSYVESGGTALSTNWEEVSKKSFPVDPPSGMVAKKW
ncbi:co-chaperone SGT1 [Ascoidea rubescens DSM 1968]|uniref:SGS-domain-containing protein n=1 Tax=Ascoidea rubescens DSM 1968 TaxID=1344418 RepID=A0A1D2VCR3_9ASCO|nr:SGS-domain-containing protein [Ascoidea rubescens DSM 1968]ODV59293.1 SGS-domain-containing protein [Ascoidea rubescens DSM 1968]